MQKHEKKKKLIHFLSERAGVEKTASFTKEAFNN
jgi:hypothetical protein